MSVGGEKFQNLETEMMRNFQVNGFKFGKLKSTFASTVDGIEIDSHTVTDNIHNCWAHGLCRYIRKIMNDAVAFLLFRFHN